MVRGGGEAAQIATRFAETRLMVPFRSITKVPTSLLGILKGVMAGLQSLLAIVVSSFVGQGCGLPSVGSR